MMLNLVLSLVLGAAPPSACAGGSCNVGLFARREAAPVTRVLHREVTRERRHILPLRRGR